MFKNLKDKTNEEKKYTSIRLNGVSYQKNVIVLIASLKPKVLGEEEVEEGEYVRDKRTEFQ